MASASFYSSLLADGVRIFERREVFSHAKAMLVDGKWAYLGSSNCDVRSFRLNFELDLLIESGDFPDILKKQILSELRKSVEIVPDVFRRPPHLFPQFEVRQRGVSGFAARLFPRIVPQAPLKSF